MASEKQSADVFEAALKRELQNAQPSNVANCPAPEILAGYYDGSLSRSERARADAHLLSCARCQSMVASVARADDADRAPLQPEASPKLFWITRLLAPVAVVGVVIAIAVGLRTRERPAPELIALAPPAVPAKLELAQRAEAPPPEVAPQAPPAPSAPVAGGVFESRKAERLARKEAAPQKSEAAVTGNSTSLQAYSSSGTARPQNAHAEVAREASVPGAAAAGSALSGTTTMMAKAPPPNEVSSPDGSVLWRFGNDGAIMRSGNSSPWLTMHSGVTTDLLAAAAPSNDVCWAVGKSGTLVRTLDGGAHWRLVNPPSRDNFAAIRATDSNNATVIAVNGQRFATHDGGVTWSSP